MKLKKIIKELEECKFECEAGYLENSIAFIELKKIMATYCVKDNIICELVETVEILGGMSDILCIVNSYNDTQTDEEILEALIQWNQIYSKKRQDGKFSPIYKK